MNKALYAVILIALPFYVLAQEQPLKEEKPLKKDEKALTQKRSYNFLLWTTFGFGIGILLAKCESYLPWHVQKKHKKIKNAHPEQQVQFAENDEDELEKVLGEKRKSLPSSQLAKRLLNALRCSFQDYDEIESLVQLDEMEKQQNLPLKKIVERAINLKEQVHEELGKLFGEALAEIRKNPNLKDIEQSALPAKVKRRLTNSFYKADAVEVPVAP